MQSAETARKDASAAMDACATAERELAKLEVDIPKARLEVDALTQRGMDLQKRLAELKSACEVSRVFGTLCMFLRPNVFAGSLGIKDPTACLLLACCFRLDLRTPRD